MKRVARKEVRTEFSDEGCIMKDKEKNVVGVGKSVGDDLYKLV